MKVNRRKGSSAISHIKNSNHHPNDFGMPKNDTKPLKYITTSQASAICNNIVQAVEAN